MGPDALNDYSCVNVVLTKRFAICKYKMTHKQISIWDNISFQEKPNYPATGISWFDCYFFLVGLSGERIRLPDKRYYRFDFPREAQWEYSCRAGSPTLYCISPNLGPYSKGYGFVEETDPVGTDKENKWGLYDTNQIVSEWCWDWFAKYPKDQVSVDPVGPMEGSKRVYRGGNFASDDIHCRWAVRGRCAPDFRTDDYNSLGFRLALSSTGIPQSPEADKSSGAGGGS
jgi:formylglycine-generating enzyme required for sulfatase activity